MDFKLSYDDAKKILNVFYNCKYNEAIGYIELLHGLKESEGDLTLKHYADIEINNNLNKEPAASE